MNQDSVENVGRVTSRSLLKHTQKNWDQWIAILNEAGGAHWNHKEIVAFLKRKYRLSLWWQQIVASGYEIVLGRRVEGQNLKGEYAVTITKSLPIGNKKLWKLLGSPKGLSLWLKPLSRFKLAAGNVFETEDGFYGEVRTLLAGRRVRLRWMESDGDSASVLQIWLVPRPGEKCILVFTHEKLKTGRLRNQFREHWRGVLEQLANSLSRESLDQ